MKKKNKIKGGREVQDQHHTDAEAQTLHCLLLQESSLFPTVQMVVSGPGLQAWTGGVTSCCGYFQTNSTNPIFVYCGGSLSQHLIGKRGNCTSPSTNILFPGEFKQA